MGRRPRRLRFVALEQGPRDSPIVQRLAHSASGGVHRRQFDVLARRAAYETAATPKGIELVAVS